MILVWILVLLFDLTIRVSASQTPLPVVIGVDAGTESLRAVVFDDRGKPISSSAVEYAAGTQYPKNGLSILYGLF